MENWKKELLKEFENEDHNTITRKEFLNKKKKLEVLFKYEEGNKSYLYYYEKGNPDYIYYTISESGSHDLTYHYLVRGLNEKIDYILNNDWSFEELYSYLGYYINIEMYEHVFKLKYKGYVFSGHYLNNRASFLGVSKEKEEIQYWQTWNFYD